MNPREENTTLFTPFWPMCMIALSMAIFLGWQVIGAGRQYISLLRLSDQQTVMSGQAAQAEAKLQAMMMDLLKLSKTDSDALVIINKYGIKYNPPPQSLGLPSEPKPAARE